jgi:hypothetical protein
MRRALAALLFVAIAMPIASFAQTASDKPFVVEYYIAAKCGTKVKRQWP